MAEKAKILLVDDRAENIVALEAILSSLNQTLVPARSGDAALKALLSDEFAVILLDVLMPGMDGFETAAHIKRRPKTRDVPIIFLTARNAEPDLRVPQLLGRRRRLHRQAVRPVGAARQGVGLRRPVHEEPAAQRPGDDAARAAAATRWPRPRPPEPTAEPVLTELSARLAAVEDMVTRAFRAGRRRPDPAITQSMRQLEHRVGRLRDIVDALRAGG